MNQNIKTYNDLRALFLKFFESKALIEFIGYVIVLIYT